MKMLTYIPQDISIRKHTMFIWEICDHAPNREKILPSGVIELIFNLSDPMSGLLPGEKKIIQSPNCFIQGIHTHTVLVNYTSRQHLFGIRLKPHAIRSVLGIQAHELLNKAVDLALIKPSLHTLWQQLREVRCFQERVKLTEIYLSPRNLDFCSQTRLLSNLFTQDSMPIINTNKIKFRSELYHEFESVDQLAGEIGISTRHLNRKTREISGLSAVEFIRYKKFLRSVQLIHEERYSLTAIAYHSGFFDQPHFIRVFKSYTGMTPRMYQLQKSILPYHIFE